MPIIVYESLHPSAVNKTAAWLGFKDLHHFLGVFHSRDTFSTILNTIDKMIYFNFEWFLEVDFWQNYVARAVVKGLKKGRIGYLGLDVYEEESGLFFEDHSSNILQDDVIARLLTFPNVLITSHQAFLTDTALQNIAETTFHSINCWEEGKRSEFELI